MGNIRRITLQLVAMVCLAGCAPAPGPHLPWTESDLGTDADFRDIYFLDEQRGWIVGGGYPVEGGILGSTEDGGTTWRFRSGLLGKGSRSHSIHLQAVQFLDERTGFIAADGGAILRTVDGGERWHTVHRSSRHFMDLQFIDDRFGWAVDGSRLFRTSDGGDSWELAIDPESGSSFNAHAIQFLDRRVGFAVGVGSSIYRTEDGGASWAQQMPPVSGRPTLRALSFVDASHGWAVGDAGAILVTADGGEHWSTQAGGTDAALTGVRFADPMAGWAVGYRRDDNSSRFLATVDGGRTWHERQRHEGQIVLALGFSETGTGWAVGERVRPFPQRILRYRPR